MTLSRDKALAVLKECADDIGLDDLNSGIPRRVMRGKKAVSDYTAAIAYFASIAPRGLLPIDTAPKDGTMILVADLSSPGERWFEVAQWDDGAWRYASREYTIPATHWAPLPGSEVAP